MLFREVCAMIVSLIMSVETNLSAFTAQVPCWIIENSNDSAGRGSNNFIASKPLCFCVCSSFAGIIWSLDSGQKLCRSSCVENLGAERNLVAFRTDRGWQLWDLDADSQQVACLSCCSSSWVCTPSSGCFPSAVGTDYQGDVRAGKLGADQCCWTTWRDLTGRAHPIAPARSRAARAAAALGIRQVTGDRDRLRPGWDITLCVRHMARHSCGISGTPGP